MAIIKQILVPDIGNFKDVEIIEVMVKAGDTVQAEDSLITIETDKATMDVPSPVSGVVKELKVKKGDKVSEGGLILTLECGDVSPPLQSPVQPSLPPQDSPGSNSPSALSTPPLKEGESVAVPVLPPPFQGEGRGGDRFSREDRGEDGLKAHASPSIRRFARELGVNLPQVKGSGEKGRVTKDDVQNFVKAAIAQPRSTGGLQIAEQPVVDFTKFGAVETKPLSRIQKLSGAYLHRNWVSIPHITQHDEADITELETFRKQIGKEYAAQGIKITPLAFLLKAVMEALQQFPDFNASLDASGENLVLKKYCHIGVAVDTPDGLVVPVLRDVNQKGIVQLAKELTEISGRAREKKLSATEMQGGCFTISSLGGIGGTAFTPIINAPEVAILGVSKSSMKPVWRDGKFEPRLMLPMSLSYDHRVIDGVAGVRFTTYLAQVLSDVRRLAL
jgi:pyruvate dehydrogenase E2 component (dihydrolipoamide acetyltransferase)